MRINFSDQDVAVAVTEVTEDTEEHIAVSLMRNKEKEKDLVVVDLLGAFSEEISVEVEVVDVHVLRMARARQIRVVRKEDPVDHHVLAIASVDQFVHVVETHNPSLQMQRYGY